MSLSVLYALLPLTQSTLFYRYGRHYPRSVAGRIFGIASLLVGVILNALFVGALTSSLSVFAVNEQANPEQGTVVCHFLISFLIFEPVGSPLEIAYSLVFSKISTVTATEYKPVTVSVPRVLKSVYLRVQVGVVSGTVEHQLAMRKNGSKGVTCMYIFVNNLIPYGSYVAKRIEERLKPSLTLTCSLEQGNFNKLEPFQEPDAVVFLYFHFFVFMFICHMINSITWTSNNNNNKVIDKKGWMLQ